MGKSEADSSDGWRELFGSRYFGTSLVLAGGVALAATNEFLALSLMPSVVDDIGGKRLFAWATTVYLVASVVGATAVGSSLSRLGPRLAYLLALGGFGVSSLGCGLAPNIELLLLGRNLQGLAAGLLTGLGYAVITTELPETLWTRGSALVSAMWGLGILIGPAAGGVVVQFTSWRWAFAGLAIATATIALAVPFSLPKKRTDDPSGRPKWAIPVWSLLSLGVAALAVSVAGVQPSLSGTAGPVAIGVIAIVVFIAVDRRSASQVLPPSAYGPGPMKWIYLTMGALMAATMVDLYVPLLGQEQLGLTALAAGFLGACPALGWTVSEVISASIRDQRVIARLITLGPAVAATGLAVGAVIFGTGVGAKHVLLFVVPLLVAGGGVGIAWPHLSAWAMSKVNDPSEGTTAAAAINAIQLIFGAFGAGLAGTVVNTTGYGDMASARWLFWTFGGIAAAAVMMSIGTRLDPANPMFRNRNLGRHRVPRRHQRAHTTSDPAQLEVCSHPGLHDSAFVTDRGGPVKYVWGSP